MGPRDPRNDRAGRAYNGAWAGDELEALRAEHRIRDKVRTRYGIDINYTDGNPSDVQAAVARAEGRQDKRTLNAGGPIRAGRSATAH